MWCFFFVFVGWLFMVGVGCVLFGVCCWEVFGLWWGVWFCWGVLALVFLVVLLGSYVIILLLFDWVCCFFGVVFGLLLFVFFCFFGFFGVVFFFFCFVLQCVSIGSFSSYCRLWGLGCFVFGSVFWTQAPSNVHRFVEYS